MGLRRCTGGGREVSFWCVALDRRFCFLYLLDDGGDQKQKNKSGGQSAALQKVAWVSSDVWEGLLDLTRRPKRSEAGERSGGRSAARQRSTTGAGRRV